MSINFIQGSMYPAKTKINAVINRPKVNLVSNHYSLKFFTNDMVVFEWNISFPQSNSSSPVATHGLTDTETTVSLDNRSLIQKYLDSAKHEIRSKLGPHFFNGTALFNFKKTDKTEYQFKVGTKQKLLLKLTPNKIDLNELITNTSSKENMLQLLNSQMKFIFRKMNYLELGFNKKYYDQGLTEKFSFDNSNFQVLKGFSAIFGSYEHGVKLMLNYSTRIICEENLWEKVMFLQSKKVPMAQIAKDWIIGKSFMTNYGNQKLIIIDDVDYNKNPNSPFPNPAFKNFAEYFLKTYHIKIKDNTQFLLIKNQSMRRLDEKGEMTRVVEKTYFVPELLKSEGIPEALRKNGKFMNEITSRAIIPISNRFSKTKDMAQKINGQESKNIDFKIEESENKTQGYLFNPPKIIMANNSTIVPEQPFLRINKLAEKQAFKSWVLIYDNMTETNVGHLMKNLGKTSDMYKFGFEEPVSKFFINKNSKPADIVKRITELKEKIQFVFLFVAKITANQIYRDVKRGLNKAGILCQFFASFNPNRDIDNLAKFKNIALQIQSKMGNNPWLIEHDLKDTLILGADVYHSRQNRSVASLVGQFGKNLRSMYTETSVQTSKYQEIIKSMGKMFLSILERYETVEKKLPDRIIFYRDGVGESFIDTILMTEVSSIVGILDKKCTLTRPKLTVVLVTKRIDDKFALVDKELSNPKSGTIIESSVVEPNRTTFFMFSHAVTQGTANPTKYQLVYDESNQKLEDLIQLTFNLCWGYFNWQGPVKVPSPVQYAHKNAYLIGELQDESVHENLKSLKFYL
jgi:aubergine-like protein